MQGLSRDFSYCSPPMLPDIPNIWACVMRLPSQEERVWTLVCRPLLSQHAVGRGTVTPLPPALHLETRSYPQTYSPILFCLGHPWLPSCRLTWATRDPKRKVNLIHSFMWKRVVLYTVFFYSDEVLLSSLDWLATCIFQTDLDLLIDLPVSVSEHCDYRRVSLCPDASCFKQPFTSAILKLWSLNQQHRDHMGNFSKYGIPLLTYQVIKHSSLCSF